MEQNTVLLVYYTTKYTVFTIKYLQRIWKKQMLQVNAINKLTKIRA